MRLLRAFLASVWVWILALPLVSILAIAVAMALAGCSTYEHRFTEHPKLVTVGLNVVWSDAATIRAKCGDGPQACATYGTPEEPISTIWAPMPTSFTDAKVCTLGHELLHALGARHQ